MPQPFRATTRVLLLTPARFLPFPETDVLTDPAEIFKAVPGLYVFPEFISVAEEEELLRKVQEHLWIELSVRQVQHHGFAFDYDINKVASLTQPPLPPWSLPVLDRLYAHPSRPPGTPTYNQLTVNQYPAGTGIPPHTDTHSGFRDNVLIVSLAHPVVMEFRTLYDPRAVPAPPHRRDPAAADPFRTVNVLLDRRSAVVLHGEARFGWEHGIRARAADVVAGRLVERKMRTSLTFREVRLWEGDEEEAEVVVVVGGAKAGPAKRKPRCDCAFPWICDARLVGGALPDRLRPAGETVNRHGVARKM
ncbi:hypothetical protein DFJ73DRAFT_620291 [Zopfochytrium polystomum]|nr:hypothetical protein DFJ73DRAFT_620291 [Zopfochytrium polystomum]